MDYWEIDATQIVYRGSKQQLPRFLPHFKIPVPNSWFDVLFRERKEKKQGLYASDAYAIATGYILYDCPAAYTASLWAEAMKVLGFAVQIEWAESARVGTDRSLAVLEVSLLNPDQHRKKLEKRRTWQTTQGQFLSFLRSGQLEDLEQPHESNVATYQKGAYGR
jgi:hypothetical protein